MIIKDKVPNIYLQLAAKYKLPHQVIEVICKHPFKFASAVITDDTNNKPIMFGYLFKIKPKKKHVEQLEDCVNARNIEKER